MVGSVCLFFKWGDMDTGLVNSWPTPHSSGHSTQWRVVRPRCRELRLGRGKSTCSPVTWTGAWVPLEVSQCLGTGLLICTGEAARLVQPGAWCILAGLSPFSSITSHFLLLTTLGYSLACCCCHSRRGPDQRRTQGQREEAALGSQKALSRLGSGQGEDIWPSFCIGDEACFLYHCRCSMRRTHGALLSPHSQWRYEGVKNGLRIFKYRYKLQTFKQVILTWRACIQMRVRWQF